MELFDYYLRYMTELLEGKRPAPEGITLTAEDEEGRTRQLTEQLASMGAADFVRACAAQDGETLPESLFDGDNGMAGFEAFLKSAQQTEEPAPQPEPAMPLSPSNRRSGRVAPSWAAQARTKSAAPMADSCSASWRVRPSSSSAVRVTPSGAGRLPSSSSVI